jgi:ADP-ribose pyrophosphatase YjhB (NUDIX family)
MPICCIDVLVANGKKFLLVKRKKAPFKNKWWLAGGRLFFNESFSAAVKRKLKEELDIKKIQSVKFLGIGATRFRNNNGYFNLPSHTINNTFLVQIDERQAKNIKLDTENHYRYAWFEKIPGKINYYLNNLLKD